MEAYQDRYLSEYQRLLAAFAAEVAILDQDEIADLAAECADAEDEALERADQISAWKNMLDRFGIG
jgi:hypothetical protein